MDVPLKRRPPRRALATPCLATSGYTSTPSRELARRRCASDCEEDIDESLEPLNSGVLPLLPPPLLLLLAGEFATEDDDDDDDDDDDGGG